MAEEIKQAIPSLEDRVRAIREREQKATKGPWLVRRRHASADRCDGIEAHIGHTHPPEQSCWDVDECPGQEAEMIVQTDGGFYGPNADDADFLAHARADIPYLLSLVEELKGQVAEIERERSEIEQHHREIKRKLFAGQQAAEAEAALLRKRKDYHAEYVEAVEAAVKAERERERMWEVLRKYAVHNLYCDALKGNPTDMKYPDHPRCNCGLARALTPEPASQAAEE